MFSLFLQGLTANTKLTLKPSFEAAAFNRTKGYKTLVEKGFALEGKQTSISGYARTCSYVDETGKQIPCSMYVIESGILLTDPCIIFYKIDSNGEATPILGPVTASKGGLGGGAYGHVLQPRLFYENGKFTAHVFFVCPGYITFSTITEEEGWKWSTVNNGGMLHPQGNRVMEFEEDYQIHAFIPNEGGKGFYIFRQPLVCIPSNEAYFSCIPLLAFDVATKTFSQVMIPHMLPGRYNKLQDPYYSITVDQKNERVILVSKKFYKAEVNNEFAYQYIPFKHPIWRNSLVENASSYYDEYDRDLLAPNNVTFEQKAEESASFQNEVSSKRKALNDVEYHRYVYFGLEASMSTFNMRTTSIGLPYYGADGSTYVTVPYNIPNNWGVNGHYDTEDIPSWLSQLFGIRLIKIENTKQEDKFIKKDDIALYLDLTDFTYDNSYLSIFAGHQSAQFPNPPIIDEKGVYHFVSLPVQVVYNCKQNFYSYCISYDPSKIEAKEQTDDLMIGSPLNAANLPTSQHLYVFDAEGAAPGKKPSQQALDLVEKYSEVYNKFNGLIATRTGYDGKVQSMYMEKEKYIDHLVRFDVDKNKDLTDIKVKLTYLPLPNNQVTVYHDTLYNKEDGQTGVNKIDSSMEIVNPDDSVISPFNFTINPTNHPQWARIFQRTLVIRNTDLFFHLGSMMELPEDARLYSIYTYNLQMENSKISIRNNQKYHLHIYNSSEINIDAIDPSINITIGSSKTDPVFRFWRKNNEAHIRTTNIEYVTLGYEFASVSAAAPELNTEKIGLTGVKEHVVIEEPCKFIDGAGYNNLNLKFRANTGTTNGLLFPKTTLLYTINKKIPIKITASEEFPFQNGETIYINDTADNTFTFDINRYLPVVTTAAVNVPLRCAVYLIAINDCSSVVLTVQGAFDGNCRVTFFNEYIEVESLGKKTRINNCTFSFLDSSATYVHLRLDPSCTRLPSDRFVNNDNLGGRRYVLDDSWDHDVEGTIKLGNSTVYIFADLNKFPTAPKFFTAGKSIDMQDINNLPQQYRKVPDLLPDPPTVCINNDDGTRSCGDDLDELLKEQEEAKLSILSSQTISGNVLNNKPVTIDSTNSANKVTIKVEEQITSPTFTASNAKLSIDSEKPVTIKSESVSLKNIPELTSTQPLTIESEDIVIDAALLQNIDSWHGSIKNTITAPKVTDDAISFDISKSEKASIDFSETVAITQGTAKFGVSEPEDREIHVKVGKEATVNYNMKIAAASMARIIEADKDSTIKFEGFVFDTQVQSKSGVAKVFASEGTVLGTPGSTLECGFGTIAQMSDNREYTYRVNTGLEGDISEVTIKNGTIVYKSGENTVEMPIRNVVLYATTPVTIKATEDADNTVLPYEVGPGGSVDIDESAKDNQTPATPPVEEESSAKVEEESTGKVEEESSAKVEEESTGKVEEESNGENDAENSAVEAPNNSNTGMIVGIVIGVLAAIAIVAGVSFYLIRKKATKDIEEDDEVIAAEAEV